MDRARRLALLLAASWLACDLHGLPPLGEALIIVDTDARVPGLVGALRVDVYSADGRAWQQSRDIPRIDPNGWPVSFSLFDPDAVQSRTAVLRLRAYPKGRTRAYRGERFTPRPETGDPWMPAPTPSETPDRTPRLLDASNADVTPAIEPQPLVTIDRLLLVRLEPGLRGSIRVVLHGNCFGTMANMANLQSCVDTENVRAKIESPSLDRDMTIPRASLQGSFGSNRPCAAETRGAGVDSDGQPLLDEEICVPGGAFLFGNADVFGLGERNGIPERVALVPSTRVDRWEVTVGRWRDALARGFVPPEPPRDNVGPLDSKANPFDPNQVTRLCTFSSNPKYLRDDYPLNCIGQRGARALCQFQGGDLLTEVEWEYVAQVFGRPTKTRYAWGDDEPTCDAVVAGRATWGTKTECAGLGLGPQPENDPHADLSPFVSAERPIMNLGGGVTELLMDGFRSLDTVCWARASLESPRCDDDTADHAIRGGTWLFGFEETSTAKRWKIDRGAATPSAGFRCARAGQ